MTTFGDIPTHKDEVIKEKTPSEPSLFLKELASMESNEEKVRACLSQMTKALAASSGVKFKEFWEAKRECLELFKHLGGSRIRSQLWTEYSTLSAEAKRLKEIKDEQASFAAEQIDLAILALEHDLTHYETLLAQIPTLSHLQQTHLLKKKKGVYEELQKELNLLSTLAARINALRKELVKTEMRLGVKSKLFDRLSSCGDRVFPRRKELVKQISEEFLADVAQFAASSFEGVKLGQDLFQMREEIKVLQMLAKELTLNSQTFSQTRLQLSECWDKLKEQEKLKKKEFEEKKAHSKLSIQELQKELEAFSLAIEEEKSFSEISKMEQELFAHPKVKALTREDFKEFKQEVQKLKKPLFERVEKEEQLKKEQERQAESKKKEDLLSLEEAINALSHEATLSAMNEKIRSLQESVKQLECQATIKDRLFRKLSQAGDTYAKRYLEQLLLQKDQEAIDGLYALLEEREERKRSIRELLESYRQMQGGSGLDFEKAMYYQEAIEEERESFEKVSSCIEEIESQLAKLEE